MEGIITEIQRFSLHDGAGIRTTVFFKGCNLRCTWCHNPETIASKQALLFYRARCIGCGACMAVCPVGAHISNENQHTIDRAKCTSCGACAKACAAEALVAAGRRVTVEAVIREILQDKLYYTRSGGGVTLSGGEVFCQSAFAEALVDACRAAAIPVAVESNLCFPFAQIAPILKKTDCIMCDIKLMDSALHRRYTGADNALILENVRRADELGIPMIVRTPLIPDVTDTAENIAAIAAYCKPLHNLVRYELLNFNPLGGGKYDALDAENPFADARPLQPTRLQQLEEVAKSAGVSVKVL